MRQKQEWKCLVDKALFKDEYKKWVDAETPCHKVKVPGFFIARYPVTKAQYRVFFQETGHENNEFEVYGQDNHPVACVTWHDSHAYCQWLNSKDLFGGMTVALPTEAQWKKAARWGTDTLYPWGDNIDSEQANYSDLSIQETCCAGCFRGGVEDRPLDMIGNVFEWTLDHWHGTYEGTPDDGSAWIDTDGGEDSIRAGRSGGAACRRTGGASLRDSLSNCELLSISKPWLKWYKERSKAV